MQPCLQLTCMDIVSINASESDRQKLTSQNKTVEDAAVLFNSDGGQTVIRRE